MNYAQGPSPVLPYHGQRDPKPAVTPGKSRALLRAFVNGKLLAEGEILQDNPVMTFSEQPNQPKQT